MAHLEQLRTWAALLEGTPYFVHNYGCRKRTYGQRRAFIGDTLANGLDDYRRGGNTSVEDREQLRRYFDALYGIEPDPDDSTYVKYDYLTVALDPLPEPTPQERQIHHGQEPRCAAAR